MDIKPPAINQVAGGLFQKYFAPCLMAAVLLTGWQTATALRSGWPEQAVTGLPSCSQLLILLGFDLTPHEYHMNVNATIEEIRNDLAKLQAEHEVLVKSHRRLVAKVLSDPTAVEQFIGQMAVDRVKVYSS